MRDQFCQGPADDFLVPFSSAKTRECDGESAVGRKYSLLTCSFDFQYLGYRLWNRHISRRFVDFPAPGKTNRKLIVRPELYDSYKSISIYLPCKVFFALFLHFNVKEDQRVHSQVRIFLDAIVKTIGFPCVREEDQ